MFLLQICHFLGHVARSNEENREKKSSLKIFLDLELEIDRQQ